MERRIEEDLLFRICCGFEDLLRIEDAEWTLRICCGEEKGFRSKWHEVQ